MKIPTPQIVRLKAELSGKDLGGQVTRVLALADQIGLGRPVTFESPLGARTRPAARLDPGTIVNHQVEFAFDDGTRLAISAHPGVAGTLIQASRAAEVLTEAQVRDAQVRQAALLRGLFASGELEAGHVERLEAGLDAIPSVPLARRLPAVVVTQAQVAAAYADTGPFWAAWGENRVQGDRHLLARHLDAAGTPTWFRAFFDDQWAMARAARPGDTFYGMNVAPPGCEDLLMRGESRLRQVGYRDGHVELAGFVPEGAHVSPWEVLSWNEVLLRGSLADGSPVRSLQVVFRNEEMARREATPLLDIGGQVAFLGRDGMYHPVG